MPVSATASIERAAVLLAAGKSTRMRSALPKALHPLCGRPLLAHLLLACRGAGFSRIVVVVGHEGERVRAALAAGGFADGVAFVHQAEQLGTGHAARMAAPLLDDFDGTCLVLPGDMPLVRPETLARLAKTREESGAQATLLTAVLPDAGHYGRVLRDPESGRVTGIVEARDACPEQLAIREIGTSTYAFDRRALFSALERLRPENAQGEYYLTDTIGLIAAAGGAVDAVVADDPDETLGVNNRIELAQAAAILRRRINERLMLAGVTFVDPATAYVDADVEIGPDTTVLPNTLLLGATVVGAGCAIGPNASLTDARLGDGVEVNASQVIGSSVGDGSRIGPFAFIRPGCRIGADVRIGDFVEAKNATIGDRVSMSHLTYIGDAEIGADTNIGAGTITSNFPGLPSTRRGGRAKKCRTTVGRGAFVGANSVLVAPVSVGDGAYVAAGSTVTDDVPADALAIARAHQTVKEGWAARKRAEADSDEGDQAG